jgi:hypothetical protein
MIPSARSDPPAIASAIQAWSESSSDGLRMKPTTTRTGSATNPLSRSMATEANDTGAEPVDLAPRLTRRTSPPIVEGSRFPTNWPAK